MYPFGFAVIDNHKLILLYCNILIQPQFLEHAHELNSMFLLCGTAAFSPHNRDQFDPESITKVHALIQ